MDYFDQFKNGMVYVLFKGGDGGEIIGVYKTKMAALRDMEIVRHRMHKPLTLTVTEFVLRD